MDIEAYISSGILENYVFDSATPQERQEVECLSKIYPEIKTELLTLQEAIEELARRNAVQPPLELKARVIKAIKSTGQEETIHKTPLILPQDKKGKNEKIIPLYKMLTAACITALIGVGSYSYFLKSDLQKVASQLATTEEFRDSLKEFNNSLIARLDKASNQNLFIRDKNTQKVVMLGTPKYSNEIATVYWNNSNEKVLLDVSTISKEATDKDYQLWVIADGTPIDMGVFDLDSMNKNELIEMKSVRDGQAFAITMEPKGGSISPTLDELVVIGMIS
jgi:hypothetical protein